MRTALRLAVLLLAVAGAGGAGVAYVFWTRLHESYRGFTADQQFVDVPPGAGAGDIARRLHEAGVIRDEQVFRLALWWSGEGRNLKAGEYVFERPVSPLEVVDTLARGRVYTRRLTFPEGLRIEEMAALYEQGGFGTAAAFLDAARDAGAIDDLDPGAPDLEGYLFPDTYVLPRVAAAPQLVAAMVARFRAVYTPELRALAEGAGLTTRQVVTLASLVEKETARADERALVAAVYRNRLRIGMPLQADPTVIYALVRAGRYDGNIRRADLSFESQYNTYRYRGLPPGPIAAPGLAAIEAALRPADVGYLYFVSRNDGSHVFAATLAEHNANVYEHQVLHFRRQRQEGGGSGSR